MPFFHTCGPNQALVVSGCCLSKPFLVPGGRAFVWPVIQQIQKISLNTMTLTIESPHVYTQLGVSISVKGIAQVKIQGQNNDMLHAACQQFLGKTENEIRKIAQETLEGHQRAIMGCMTVEEIYQDRKKFSRAVFEVASSDLVNMGISVVSYTIHDIRDDELVGAPLCSFFCEHYSVNQNFCASLTLDLGHVQSNMPNDLMAIEKFMGYLKSLGMSRTAQVKRDARIGEAEARRDATVKSYLKALGLTQTARVKCMARIGEAEARCDATMKEAVAEEQRMKARYENDVEIAKAQRDFELKKAAYDMEVHTKKAQSDMAYHLQAAITKQKIKEEQMQIKVVERSQHIQVQEQEITRKERELDALIRKPAEAEKFRLETLAEAQKRKVVLEASAEAEAIQVKGDAEAFAIESKARAEAEQMAKKADAWKDYQDAAMVDMVLETMPKIAAEVAAPLAQAKKITMVSTGNGEVGAAKLTGEVLAIIEKLPKVVENMTGVDVSKALHKQHRAY